MPVESPAREVVPPSPSFMSRLFRRSSSSKSLKLSSSSNNLSKLSIGVGGSWAETPPQSPRLLPLSRPQSPRHAPQSLTAQSTRGGKQQPKSPRIGGRKASFFSWPTVPKDTPPLPVVPPPLGVRRPLIISVGQFRPEKAHATQIEAFARFVTLFCARRAARRHLHTMAVGGMNKSGLGLGLGLTARSRGGSLSSGVHRRRGESAGTTDDGGGVGGDRKTSSSDDDADDADADDAADDDVVDDEADGDDGGDAFGSDVYDKNCSAGECPVPRLVLIGGARNAGDRARVRDLKRLAVTLGVRRYVTFRVNAPFSVLKSYLATAVAGLHSMRDEHFGMCVVEYMAAGVVVVAHNRWVVQMLFVMPL
jgi:hypothetical protein